MALAVTILYTLSLFYLFLFSLGQLHLTYIYLRKVKGKKPVEPSLKREPFVTIQLPVYNEKYVVERLIEAVANIDYPKEKMEVQILDDSTDETSGIIYQKIEWLKKSDLNIRHLHRADRKGFKAGALDEGLHSANGDFIVIFDSDFVPAPEFLKRTLPYFEDPKVGVVQTRWGHINEDYSLITQIQAFGLDAHFSIEQSARNEAGSFINFNGTCGIWRKECIVDAGGWSADTLTEDLDLSYRAQLKGWKFKYLEDVVTPGELPVVMPVIKLQQYRWNKGAAETARKLIGKVLRAPLPPLQKMHAFLHLFNSSVFVALFLAAVLSLPIPFIKNDNPSVDALFKIGLVFLFGFFSVGIFYWTATKRFYTSPGHKFIILFPAFLVVSMGLCLHNSIAVLEGWLGRKTPFIRTPKFNIVQKRDPWSHNTYLSSKVNLITLLEGALCACFIFAMVKGVEMEQTSLLIFHGMLAIGFGTVFLSSLKPWANA
ncbi:MAG TPA: cellulose synthase family protein [Chryseosolibacter sp.]|jgi:cellulose synthase/poly-beta-1,6-N-acetylglucosamine synthase-like glycosyltransferase|nr:cellulose synthase family protein [Chryseosolibacter sp.]